MIPLRRKDVFAEPRPMFATCDIGLESALAASLEAVGATAITPVQRGVGFVGDRELCWRINLESRVASRVLVPIAEFPAADKDELLAGATEAPWSAWFQVSKTIAVDATSLDSAMDHTGYIAQVVKDGVCDHFRAASGRRPDVDKKFPDIRINARIEGDRCIVSLDSSGVSLDRRGYRREAGPAPLRETLAAGCLFFSGWTPGKVLVDPMCGAGTLLIEAALVATNTPPGLGRGRRGHFSFTHWYGHRQSRFEALLDELEGQIVEAESPIFGSDVDPEVLGHALRNAERAGVAEAITFAQQPVSAARPPAGIDGGVVLCNPPYGHRIGRPDQLQALYATLGRTLKFEFGGWDVWLLVGDGAPVRNVGMSPTETVHLRNGPIECRLLQYEVFKGRPSLIETRERRAEQRDERHHDGRHGGRGGPSRHSGGGRRSGGRDRDDRRGGRRDDRRDGPGGRDGRRSGAGRRGGPSGRRDDRRDDRRGPPRGDRRDDRRGPPHGDRDDRRGPPRGDRRDDRRGPPRGDRRDDRRGPPRGDRDDRRGPPRGDRDDRRGPPRGDRDDRRGPPRGDRRDDRRGPPRGDRNDRHGPPRGDRDDRRGPPRGDRHGPPRGDRNDRHGPPRGDRNDRHGPPRGDRRDGPPRGPRPDRGGDDRRPRTDRNRPKQSGSKGPWRRPTVADDGPEEP